MTKERYIHKLVMTFACYENGMNKLMSTNEGLCGRSTEMIFPKMKPKDCLCLFQKRLCEKQVRISCSMRKQDRDMNIDLFKELGETKLWANGRM
ncbi:hypothetical protein BGW36DRAFT_136754 [Talaromyces proteolyticus]|uniref:Uncharacterized protein n=1 Tax=Talaromyces proteolyticus TaxID=1131652 RepID=A0AAD4KVM9_9EURO|nr:uncharacterized protein BGW36DRAFT_136754 [Talaromyces proteolyticus]KAH8700825.1 hypothetical protein BGW36DRAFT_136754 [Talaromyces proteolyticus]